MKIMTRSRNLTLLLAAMLILLMCSFPVLAAEDDETTPTFPGYRDMSIFDDQIYLYDMTLGTDSVTLTDDMTAYNISFSASIHVPEGVVLDEAEQFELQFEIINDSTCGYMHGFLPKLQDGNWVLSGRIMVDTGDPAETMVLREVRYGAEIIPFQTFLRYTVIDNTTPPDPYPILVPELPMYYCLALAVLLALFALALWRPSVFAWTVLGALTLTAMAAALRIHRYYDRVTQFQDIPRDSYAAELTSSVIFCMLFALLLILVLTATFLNRKRNKPCAPPAWVLGAVYGILTAAMQFFVVPVTLSWYLPESIWVCLMILLPVVIGILLFRKVRPYGSLWIYLGVILQWVIALVFREPLARLLSITGWFSDLQYLFFAGGWPIGAAIALWIAVLIYDKRSKHDKTPQPYASCS